MTNHLYAKNGGVLDVSSLTSYTGSDDFDTTFKAEGSGSKLDVSGITNLTGGTWIYHHKRIRFIAYPELTLE